MNEIISKEFNGIKILFSIDTDLYLHTTAIAKKFNKQPRDWLKTTETNDYIKVLSSKINLTRDELVIVRQGGKPQEQGTWIHKKLIIAFARWLSPEFAIWSDFAIEDILKTLQNKPNLPIQKTEIQEQREVSEEILKFIKLLKTQDKITLFYFSKFWENRNEKSPLELFGINFANEFFIPTELGKIVGKSPVEINKILEFQGFQIRENEVWQLTENGKKFGIEVGGKFHQIKWKLEVII